MKRLLIALLLIVPSVGWYGHPAAEPGICLTGMSGYDGDPSAEHAGRFVQLTLLNYDAYGTPSVTTWYGVLDSTDGVAYFDTSTTAPVCGLTNRNMFTLSVEGYYASSGWNQCDFKITRDATYGDLVFSAISPGWVNWSGTGTPPFPAVSRVTSPVDPGLVGWTPPPPPTDPGSISPVDPGLVGWTPPA